MRRVTVRAWAAASLLALSAGTASATWSPHVSLGSSVGLVIQLGLGAGTRLSPTCSTTSHGHEAMSDASIRAPL